MSSGGEDRRAQAGATAIPWLWVSCLYVAWHRKVCSCHSPRSWAAPGCGRRPGPRPSVHALSPPRVGAAPGLRNLLQAPERSGIRKCGLCGLQTFSPTPQSQGTSKGAPTVLTSRSEIKAVSFPNIQGLQLLGGLQETTSPCRTSVKDVSSSQASIDLSPFFSAATATC